MAVRFSEGDSVGPVGSEHMVRMCCPQSAKSKNAI
jgi:hypothetical protein